MSIADALSYPFRNNNLFKILPIAIVYGIIVFLMTYSSMNGLMPLICGASVALFVFSFVLGGYYISVIEQVQHGEERLRDVKISLDLSRGVAVWLASILYFLPLVLFGCVAAFLSSMLFSANDADVGLSLVVVLVGAVVIIPLMIFLGLALVVGYNRYAAEGNTQGLYALTENFGMAWQNAGHGFGLVLRSIAIGLINGFVVFVLQIIIGIAFPQQFDPFAQPTLSYWISFALVQVLSYTVSLVFIVSQYHLVARYGMALGITSEKRKAGEASGGMSVWVIVALVVVLFFMIAVGTIVILTLLGPAVGNVFSEINQTLAAPGLR